MWIVCQVDNSHEMSVPVFCENEKKKMSSAANFAWHFMGWLCMQQPADS